MRSQITPELLADQAGLSTEVVTALWHILSRSLGAYGGTRSSMEQVLRVVGDVVSMEFEREGCIVRVPLPEMQAVQFPRGKTALRALGMTSEDIDALWLEQRAFSVDRPLLPLAVVLAFVPIDGWRALATFIAWGPVEAQARLDVLVAQYQNRPARTTRALRDPKHSHGLAPKTIASRLGSVRGFMQRVVDVQKRGLPSDGLLDDWTDVPPLSAGVGSRKRAERTRPVTDRSAPSLRELRRALKLADRAVADARRTKQGRSNMMRLLRARALLAAATVTGLRINVLRTAELGWYRRDYMGWADGAMTSALVVPTIKSDLGWQPKPLPPLVEEWLIEYLDYVGYARIERHEDGTFVRRRDGRLKEWTITGEEAWPLWVSRFQRGRDNAPVVDHEGRRVAVPQGLSEGSMYHLFAGARGRKRDQEWTQRPLILHRSGRGEWHGYSPHAYRHAADQLVVRAAWDIRPQHPALAHWSPQDFAHALLDQSFANELGAVYGDKEANRSWAARLAGLAVWELAWGDAGADLVPDIGRQQRARASLNEAGADVALQLARKQAVLHEMDLLDHERPRVQCSGDALVRWYGEREREHRTLSRQLIRVTDAIVLAERREAEATAEVKLALEARVPIDDLIALDSLDDLHEVEPDEAEDEHDDAQRMKRGYVWSTEAAQAFDVSENTMKRWRAGSFSDRVRVPWDRPQPGETLCSPWEQVSGRLFRLWVVDLDGAGRATLDPARVPPAVLERLRVLMSTDG